MSRARGGCAAAGTAGVDIGVLDASRGRQTWARQSQSGVESRAMEAKGRGRRDERPCERAIERLARVRRRCARGAEASVVARRTARILHALQQSRAGQSTDAGRDRTAGQRTIAYRGPTVL